MSFFSSLARTLWEKDLKKKKNHTFSLKEYGLKFHCHGDWENPPKRNFDILFLYEQKLMFGVYAYKLSDFHNPQNAEYRFDDQNSDLLLKRENATCLQKTEKLTLEGRDIYHNIYHAKKDGVRSAYCFALIDFYEQDERVWVISNCSLGDLEKTKKLFHEFITGITCSLPKKENGLTAGMTIRAYDEAIRATLKESIRFTVTPGVKPELWNSKYGGLPYLPYGATPPKDKDGKELRFLAQLNLSELPENHLLPAQGMLQFYILQNDLYGLNLADPAAGHHKVVYYPTVDQSITESAVAEKVHPYIGEEYFPIEREYKIKARVGYEGIGTCERDFESTFIKYASHLYPNLPRTELKQAIDEFDEVLWRMSTSTGSKVGGYPCFKQGDFRTSWQQSYELLFQMDSECGEYGEYEIMWGDYGTANFFIRKEDLKYLNFDHTLYHWDCG